MTIYMEYGYNTIINVKKSRIGYDYICYNFMCKNSRKKKKFSGKENWAQVDHHIVTSVFSKISKGLCIFSSKLGKYIMRLQNNCLLIFMTKRQICYTK